MKNTLKNTLFFSSLLIGTFAISPSVLADTSKAENTASTTTSAKSADEKKQDKVNKKAIADHKASQKSLLANINKGVNEGFKHVAKAVEFLNKKKDKEAIKSLQDATGKFDIALAADPKMGLIPVDAKVIIHELNTSTKAVKAQVALATDFLKASKVQAARTILLPLRDDIESHTTFLPMTTYPDAIKLATKMLVEGKREAALATLSTAFSTLVEETSITPLSLIRTVAIIKSASELDKEKDKDKALILLTAAEEQLNIATALGYTTKNTALYEGLITQIAALKKEVTGGNIVEKLYKKLRESADSLIKKLSNQKSKSSDKNDK